MCIYKAFKNIWMIVLNILGYLCRNKQNSYAALTKRPYIFGNATLDELSITKSQIDGRGAQD